MAESLSYHAVRAANAARESVFMIFLIYNLLWLFGVAMEKYLKSYR